MRFVRQSGLGNLEAYQSSKTIRRLQAEGRAISAIPAGEAEDAPAWAEAERGQGRVVRHERIPFISYPEEWTPSMLYAAGELTLELAEGLISEGLGLKDATPRNILFRGATPVFIDSLSVERRAPGDARWLAHAQFVRTFLLPLLARRDYHWPLALSFRGRRDGLEPEDFWPMVGPLRRLTPSYFGLVTMPALLGRRAERRGSSLYDQRLDSNPERARFILGRTFGSLRRRLHALEAPAPRDSTWSGYLEGNNNYAPEAFSAKERFVESALGRLGPRRLLDVGANNGHFSFLAARAGASVVAIDADEEVADRTSRAASQARLDVLTLVIDLARPTPAAGWRNRESQSFLDRAGQSFDCLLALALIHHLLVTERIPADEIFSLAAHLTSDAAIVEFVGPGDSMFKLLTRGRDDLHRDWSQERFQQAASGWFSIEEVLPLPNSERVMYLLRRKRAG